MVVRLDEGSGEERAHGLVAGGLCLASDFRRDPPYSAAVEAEIAQRAAIELVE